MNFIHKRKLINLEMIVTSIVILVCMILFSFFPVKGIFQQVVLSIVFLFLVPFLYIRIVFKDKLRNFGFQAGGWREGFLVIPICFLVMTGLTYAVFKYTGFRDTYFLGDYSFTQNFAYLSLYEFAVVNLWVVLYEFFFRGFVMFYFRKKIGAYAIFLQFLFFILFFNILEKLNIDNIFYILIAPLAGWIAYRSKSLVYSYFFSIIVLVIVDIIYLKLAK